MYLPLTNKTTMLKRFFSLLLIAVLVVAAIVLVNTYRYSKPFASHSTVAVTGISDSAAGHLSKAIQIKTVSFGDTMAIDTSEFLKFRSFIEQTYPLIHQKLQRQIFHDFSYVYKWTGKDTSLAPYVLMGHTDVVPVEAVAEKKWTVPSFSGIIKDNAVWGRGAVDDKGSVIAVLEAVEQLLAEGYRPPRTFYLCFGHDEEIAGRRGAANYSKWFKENNIHPDLVVDEGGQVDTKHFKDLKHPVALLGVGEKGYVNIDLLVEKTGGHSSMPEKETAVDILAAAIKKTRETQMPARITGPVQQMFNHIGPGMGFTNRMALSNMWLFKGLFISELEKTKETNATIHTTLVPTIVNAGIKDNVIPTVAKATFNSRILPGETSDDVLQFVIKTINDERVQVKKQTISLIESSKPTSAESDEYKKAEAIINKLVPDVITTPYLVIGATDSRYFREQAKSVINFYPMTDAKGFHGIDEQLPVEDLKRMIMYYKMILSEK